jgi:hypothetical protein
MMEIGVIPRVDKVIEISMLRRDTCTRTLRWNANSTEHASAATRG